MRKFVFSINDTQCLGSGSGSARFLLLGSGSTELDPSGKIYTKNYPKLILLIKPKSEK